MQTSGYFVSIAKDSPAVFVHSIKYGILPRDEGYPLSGVWKPSTFRVTDNHVILERTPGYHLQIDKIDNVYFEKFVQAIQVHCNSWGVPKNGYPYKVTRFKHDRMFLLLSMNNECEPLDVRDEDLMSAIKRSGVNLQSAKIIKL